MYMRSSRQASVTRPRFSPGSTTGIGSGTLALAHPKETISALTSSGQFSDNSCNQTENEGCDPIAGFDARAEEGADRGDEGAGIEAAGGGTGATGEGMGAAESGTDEVVNLNGGKTEPAIGLAILAWPGGWPLPFPFPFPLPLPLPFPGCRPLKLTLLLFAGLPVSTGISKGAGLEGGARLMGAAGLTSRGEDWGMAGLTSRFESPGKPGTTERGGVAGGAGGAFNGWSVKSDAASVARERSGNLLRHLNFLRGRTPGEESGVNARQNLIERQGDWPVIIGAV